MSRKTCIKSIAAVAGAALAGSLSAVDLASAAENPFGASQPRSGYMVLASTDEEGKCGDAKKTEAKCGDAKKMEAKCGDAKKMEAKSGDAKKMEEKCGSGKSAERAESDDSGKMKEGKCGEGKCSGGK